VSPGTRLPASIPQDRLPVRGFTLIELLVVIIVLGIAAAIAVPAIARSIRNQRLIACSKNLADLWKAQETYRITFGGADKLRPRETGGAFWLKFARTDPPLLDAARAAGPACVFDCPLKPGAVAPGTADYRGPAEDLNAAPVEDNDPIGADREHNHGPQEGGNVLRKAGDVLCVPPEDPHWEAAKKKTAP